MLCVDLKIFAKALPKRLKKTMSLLVHSDQTCGVPGRSATWNLHLIRDAISWAGDRNVLLALIERVLTGCSYPCIVSTNK
ncbi:hypothetical protein SRHO_G00187030 [Serrasalmus rhombeus]